MAHDGGHIYGAPISARDGVIRRYCKDGDCEAHLVVGRHDPETGLTDWKYRGQG